MTEQIDFAQITKMAQDYKDDTAFATTAFPIIYPAHNNGKPGKFRLKLFINPNTLGEPWRRITTHKFEDKSFMCMKMYDQPCEMCDVIMTKGELYPKEDRWKIQTRYSFYTYAQLIDTNCKLQPGTEKGAIVVLQYPSAVQNSFMELFGNITTATEILSLNGKIIEIINNPEAKDYKERYTVTVLDELHDCSSIVEQNKTALVPLSNFRWNEKPDEQSLNAYRDGVRLFNMSMNSLANVRSGSLGEAPPLGTPKTPPINLPEQPLASNPPLPPKEDNNPKPTEGNPKCFGEHVEEKLECLQCPVEMECEKSKKK